MNKSSLDLIYENLLNNSFSNIIKESKPGPFPKRKPGHIDLGVVIYNILRERFDKNNPDATSTVRKSFYCHLKNFLLELDGNNQVPCEPVIDVIEAHSYSSSRRNQDSINISVYTSDKYKRVYYPDPNFKISNGSDNSVMIGRKLVNDGYKNIMTSVDVCV
jgi:hypothetical protein